MIVKRSGAKGISRKIYLEMCVPSDADPVDDQARVMQALADKEDEMIIPRAQTGGNNVIFSYRALRNLHAACLEGNWKITLTLAWDGTRWVIVQIQAGDHSQEHYGYAVDLGSTSVTLQLVDCESCRVLSAKSSYNRQIRFGEDILTRIFYCKDSPEKLEEIRQETVRTIRELMERADEEVSAQGRMVTGVSMVAAGNTTMIHFLLGLDPFSVFAAPNAVCSLAPGFFPGRELGFPMDGFVFAVPGRSNYVGGDIISGMAATQMYQQDRINVFFDIGTNGELVAGNKDFLLCGAGAAGPALEGGSVSTGMRAATGAVDRVKLENGRFRVHVIDEKGAAGIQSDSGRPAGGTDLDGKNMTTMDGSHAALGICGSGIVDLLSELFIHGWVDLQGTLQPEKSPRIRLVSKEDGTQEYAVFYTDKLAFTQSDILEFIRTKAAAVTMMDTMLSAAGIDLEKVEHFYMAGAFGAHVNKESAVNIGMYPDVPREKIVQVGNTSLAGARKILLDCSLLSDLPHIIENMDYLAFARMGDFIERMHAAMALPHTEVFRYPSVMARLGMKDVGTGSEDA